MSGLALVAAELGASVTGSDRSGDSSYVARLRRAGIEPVVGHDAANVPEGAEVVYSTAIPPENPERAAAARELHRADLRPDPIEQFNVWLEEANRSGVIDPTALSLATVGRDGRPRVRTVLLKGLTSAGFVFFTNFESRKGQQLGDNPQASLLFPWLALERQIIVTGPVESVGEEASGVYFHSRPRESQLAAWASAQSRPVASRADLDAGLAAVQARHPDCTEVPLPPFWGGYRVRPDTIEFWQGRANRMHDRFEYTRQADGAWTIERLSP